MSRQHYLPATYIGGFSRATKGKRRDRPVWCLRRGSPEPWQDLPRNIMHKRDLYVAAPGIFYAPEGTTEAEERNAIDQVWSGYESHLPRALAQLIRRDVPLSGDLWLRVLVPFVTGLFARCVDFFEDVDRELRGSLGYGARSGIDPVEEMNISRILLLQRLLAPVCAARWRVIHAPPGSRLIASDRSLGRAFDSSSETPTGWLIPLGTQATLALVPQQRGPVLTLDERRDFIAIIEHYDQDDQEAARFNDCIAHAAREMIVGATREDVEHLRDVMDEPSAGSMEIMSGWGQLSDWSKRAHEFEWHRLAAMVTKGIGADRIAHIEEDLDFQALKIGGWHPPIMFPDNLPTFPTGLGLGDPGLLELDLSVPDDIAESALW